MCLCVVWVSRCTKEKRGGGHSTILLRAFRGGSKGWGNNEIQHPSARPGSPQLHSHQKKRDSDVFLCSCMTIMCGGGVIRALGALEESRTNSPFRKKRVFPEVVGEPQTEGIVPQRPRTWKERVETLSKVSSLKGT